MWDRVRINYRVFMVTEEDVTLSNSGEDTSGCETHTLLVDSSRFVANEQNIDQISRYQDLPIIRYQILITLQIQILSHPSRRNKK